MITHRHQAGSGRHIGPQRREKVRSVPTTHANSSRQRVYSSRIQEQAYYIWLESGAHTNRHTREHLPGMAGGVQVGCGADDWSLLHFGRVLRQKYCVSARNCVSVCFLVLVYVFVFLCVCF
jgi:hypothetical protein